MKSTSCKICHNLFQKSSPNHKYCSKRCKNKAAHPACTRARKKRGLNRKYKFVQYLGDKCSTCGYKSCLSALVFHHRNPADKSFTLDQSNLYKYGDATLIAELAKCDLLCQNCHAELHEIERNANRSQNPRSISKYKQSVNNKLKLIANHGGRCNSCGYNKSFTQSYCFHHLDPTTKLFEVNALSCKTKAFAIVETEAQKCQLLCLNCHHELHYD